MSTLSDKITFLEGILQVLKNVPVEDYDLFRSAFLDTAGDDFKNAVKFAMQEVVTATVKIDPETGVEYVDPIYPDQYDITVSPPNPYTCTQGMLRALVINFLQILLLSRWANTSTPE